MKNIKIIFIVVALAAAVTITLVYGLGEGDIPETDEPKAIWLCGECNHAFKMSQAEESEAAKRGPYPWPPAICPECGEQAAYRALICGVCGEPYLGPGTPGGFDKCPRCFPEAKKYEPEEEEELYEEGGNRRRLRQI